MKTNINNIIAEKIGAYKEAPTKRQRDKAFEDITTICKPIINYTISRLKYKPPITKDELFMVAESEIFFMLETYKQSDTVTFTNYTITYLTNNLIKYIRKNQGILSTSHNQYDKNAKITNIIENYAAENGGNMPDYDVFEKEGFSRNDVLNYNNTRPQTYIDVHEIPSALETGTYDKYDLGDPFENDTLNDLYYELSEPEQTFLVELVNNEMNFTRTAEKLGCSKENVRQKYNKLLAKLQSMI